MKDMQSIAYLLHLLTYSCLQIAIVRRYNQVDLTRYSNTGKMAPLIRGTWVFSSESDPLLQHVFNVEFGTEQQMLAGLDYMIAVVCYMDPNCFGWSMDVPFDTPLFLRQLADGSTRAYTLDDVQNALMSRSDWFSTFLRSGSLLSIVEAEELPAGVPCIVVEHIPGMRYITVDQPSSIAGIRAVSAKYFDVDKQPTITHYASRAMIA